MSDEHPQTPPAGWYPDPAGNGQRFWDGTAWSEQTAEATPTYPRYDPQPGPPSPYGAAQSPYAGSAAYPNHPYAQGGQPPYPYAKPDPGNTLSIIGIVLGALAFLVCPVLLGPAGLVLGGIAMSKKEKLAPVALVVSGLGLVVGMIIGAVVYSSMG